MRHFDSNRCRKNLRCRCRRQWLDRNKGSLQCQVFLRMHPNPFMDKVCIEVVGQGDIGNRGVKERELRETTPEVGREVTAKTKSGVRTRFDMLGRDADGNISCIECKSSDTAPLTRNQKLAYPEIEESGAVVVGKGKPGFPGGTVIPPTKVEIVRRTPATASRQAQYLRCIHRKRRDIYRDPQCTGSIPSFASTACMSCQSKASFSLIALLRYLRT